MNRRKMWGLPSFAIIAVCLTASSVKNLYRVFHLFGHLGWVYFDLNVPSYCPATSAKFPSAQVKTVEYQNPSQPKAGARANGTPCRMWRKCSHPAKVANFSRQRRGKSYKTSASCPASARAPCWAPSWRPTPSPAAPPATTLANATGSPSTPPTASASSTTAARPSTSYPAPRV